MITLMITLALIGIGQTFMESFSVLNFYFYFRQLIKIFGIFIL
jgi:hypothetical protein